MTVYWNEKNQPISTEFDDVYFSTDDGLAETRYVFLQHNHLAERFQQLEHQQLFIIAETGFGTGLNFLSTCQLWSQYQTNHGHLHFISTEKYPLSVEELTRALKLWPELAEFSEPLIAQYPTTIEGIHRIHFTAHNISLSLIIGDACQGLKQLLVSRHPLYQTPQWQGVDAWFLDGFNPAKNPDMWTPQLYKTIVKLSNHTATFATFTAASAVRLGLSDVGFTVKKAPGFGAKREMLFGLIDNKKIQALSENIKNVSSTKALSPTKNNDNAPWMVIENHQNTPTDKTIAIIGGGIAGCHTAYALAQKGYRVTLFEPSLRVELQVMLKEWFMQSYRQVLNLKVILIY